MNKTKIEQSVDKFLEALMELQAYSPYNDENLLVEKARRVLESAEDVRSAHNNLRTGKEEIIFNKELKPSEIMRLSVDLRDMYIKKSLSKLTLEDYEGLYNPGEPYDSE